MTDKDTIKALEDQAKNTKYLMDRLNKAYIGITTDELFEAVLKEVGESVRRDGDHCRSGGGDENGGD